MNTIIRLLKWFWRFWPVITVLVLFLVHLLLLRYFYLSASDTNKTISLFSQIVGGLLILYSIDSNIGIIKQKNLFTIFVGYLREFPLFKRSGVFEMPSVSAGTAVIKGKFITSRNPESIEEKLEYLQEQINEVKRDIEQESKELNEKIDRQSKELKIQIQETGSKLEKIESKIEEVSIGGVKVQLFGVLLMVYGSISGYLV